MFSYYLPIKHLHMTAAGLSLLLFVIRAYWSVTSSPILQHKLVRTLPHVVDTILLLCGVTLATMLGAAANQPWLLLKIVLLIAYIMVGSFAIKRGRTPTSRGIAALIAIAIFVYIIGIAVTRSSLSWFF